MFPVIISAEPDELKFFLQDFKLAKEQVLGFTRMFWGEYQGVKLGLACLGVGKVNAAAGTSLVINEMQPDMIFMVGAAGALSPELVPGDIVVGTEMVDRDVGYLTERGHIPGGAWIYDKTKPYYPYLVRSIPPNTKLIDIARRVAFEIEPDLESFGEREAKVFFGPIATGEQFVASLETKEKLNKAFSALAGEMEGSSLAQVAYALDVPFLILRGISDHADDTLDLKDPLVYKDTITLEKEITAEDNKDPMEKASEAATSLHSVFQKAAYNASIMVWGIISSLLN